MTPQPLNRPCGVDVLRVLDEVRSFSREWAGNDLAIALDEARAAVAELIDAVGHWCALMPGLAGGPEFDRMRAALAAVEGKA